MKRDRIRIDIPTDVLRVVRSACRSALMKHHYASREERDEYRRGQHERDAERLARFLDHTPHIKHGVD
jgi:hypothetical protein